MYFKTIFEEKCNNILSKYQNQRIVTQLLTVLQNLLVVDIIFIKFALSVHNT